MTCPSFRFSSPKQKEHLKAALDLSVSLLMNEFETLNPELSLSREPVEHLLDYSGIRTSAFFAVGQDPRDTALECISSCTR